MRCAGVRPASIVRSLHPKHLHHLIPQVIDDLHRDPPRFRLGERARSIAVEALPGFLVDLGLEGRLQRLVGVVGAEEIGVADEEAFLVVVGVDEPAGDAFGAVGLDLAGLGLEDVDAVDLHLDVAAARLLDVDVGLAEHHEEVARCRSTSARRPCAGRGSCGLSARACGRACRTRRNGHRS